MSKMSYKISTACLLGCFLFFLTGCNSWLDLLPENQQTTDMYWKTKEDVEAVVISGYIRMKSCLEKFVQWGELRGDGLQYIGSTAAEQDVVELQMLTTNTVSDWYNIYRVIGSANAVIRYAPTVQTHDETFLTEVMNSYVAEAIFQRSLCYFWLVKTFHEVPLLLDPYVDDSTPYTVPKNTEREILDQIIADLSGIAANARPGFEVPEENKGRATRWAVYALLADIYLWDEQYGKCISACNEILTAGQQELLPAKNWYELYYPGNSKESIFELNYDQSTVASDKNDLFTWFYGDKPKYAISANTLDLLDADDIRGEGGSYNGSYLWKYAGTARIGMTSSPRGSGERDAHWIFYRLPDILLMKAEALILSANGNREIFEEATELVNTLRRRAEIKKDLEAPTTADECLQLVLNERQIEFIGEGKRWFDILRTAKRNNYEKRSYLVNILLNGLSAQDRLIYEAKLEDENSYYLPILQKEIDNSGGLLVQNPYYNGLD